MQMLRFGLVGGLATLVHMVVGSVLILGGLAATTANLLAFGIAFFVSFAGHYGYSFAQSGQSIGQSLTRFTFVAAGGFAVNQSLLVVMLRVLGIEPVAALLSATASAAAGVFLLLRLWAFRAVPFETAKEL